MDELIPITFANHCVDTVCPTCWADPWQMCSTEDPDHPGTGIEHATLIHRSRTEGVKCQPPTSLSNEP